MPKCAVSRTDRFLKQAARLLDDDELAKLAEAFTTLPDVFGSPHTHAGLGLRKLTDDVLEFRIGRRWRVLFYQQDLSLTAFFLGNHDDVRRWLKTNR